MSLYRFCKTSDQANLEPTEFSSLVPGVSKWWDFEYQVPDIEFPYYDNYVEKSNGAWKKEFQFRFEAAELEEFEPMVSLW